MTKLPVWATVREAYRAVWTHRWTLLRFAAIPFVLFLAIDLASAWIGGILPLENEQHEWSWRAIAVGTCVSLLLGLITIAFLVPCYRLLLLGPTVVMARESLPARRMYLGMAALIFLYTVLLEVPMVLVDFMLESSGGRIWPMVGLFHVAIFLLLVVRLAFLYPAICLGEQWQLARRWRQTAGNLWRISAALLLVSSPLLIAMALWAASYFLWWDEASDALPASTLFENFLGSLLVFVGDALWTAVIAVAFAVLTGYPARGLQVPTARETA